MVSDEDMLSLVADLHDLQEQAEAHMSFEHPAAECLIGLSPAGHLVGLVFRDANGTLRQEVLPTGYVEKFLLPQLVVAVGKARLRAAPALGSA